MQFRFSIILSSLILISPVILAQEGTRDTLQEVIIHAYGSNKPLSDVAAPVSYLSKSDLVKFNGESMVTAVNTIAGVRMEERSPGSYRFSIRGSLLRSPFGVRNVKIYWNGLQLTDGGGNTYLNLLDADAIGSVEIIKGPGGSLYGAGTGGVILLESPRVLKDGVDLSLSVGGFGFRKLSFRSGVKRENVTLNVQYAYQAVNGFREQSAMSRHFISGDATFLINTKTTLTANLFFSDLFYETPGGLTQSQYDEHPWQARPASAFAAGAVEQEASILNRTPFGGLTLEHEWTEHFLSRVSVVANYSNFLNVAIRNFETRTETNVGARAENTLLFGKTKEDKFIFGGEWQQFISPLDVYGNRQGKRDTLQFSDDLESRLYLGFVQVEKHLPFAMIITLGSSINWLEYYLRRVYPTDENLSTSSDAVIAPRAALLKKFGNAISVFASVSKGFSPPTLAEVRPSTNTFKPNLESEVGTNYEIGLRSNQTKKYFVDLSVYRFQLKNTIVPRQQADGAEFFVNAGSTAQSGLEVSVTGQPIKNSSNFITNLKVNASYAHQRYRFHQFTTGAGDFSGNKLTGVPEDAVNVNADANTRNGMYFSLNAQLIDRIPLNDANTEYAKAYQLISVRVGVKKHYESVIVDFFTGANNLLDERYSLGNDLNAAAGRYFNAAPPRNVFAGLSVSFQ